MSNSLFNQYRKEAWDSFIPMNATIELSVKCNFKCLHCYNFDRSKAPDPKRLASELSSEEILETIDKLKEMGSLYLSFTGGEPLLHPDIFDFLERGKKHQFLLRLKTNGQRLSPELCLKLKEHGVRYIDVSIYGADESSYESFTRSKGSYEKVMAGIRNAHQVGLKVTGNIVVHKLNYRDLPKMVSDLKDIGVDYSYSDEITERYVKADSPKVVELGGEDYKYAFQDPELREYFYYKHKDGFSPQCACARTNLGISSQGDIYPCIGAPLKVGNIREDDLQDIWLNSDKFNEIRGLKKKDFKSCSPCEVKEYCLRSSGAVYANTGDYTGCDPATKRLAEIRATTTL